VDEYAQDLSFLRYQQGDPDVLAARYVKARQRFVRSTAEQVVSGHLKGELARVCMKVPRGIAELKLQSGLLAVSIYFGGRDRAVADAAVRRAFAANDLLFPTLKSSPDNLARLIGYCGDADAVAEANFSEASMVGLLIVAERPPSDVLTAQELYEQLSGSVRLPSYTGLVHMAYDFTMDDGNQRLVVLEVWPSADITSVLAGPTFARRLLACDELGVRVSRLDVVDVATSPGWFAYPGNMARA
jgi:hypothetical protein